MAAAAVEELALLRPTTQPSGTLVALWLSSFMTVRAAAPER